MEEQTNNKVQKCYRHHEFRRHSNILIVVVKLYQKTKLRKFTLLGSRANFPDDTAAAWQDVGGRLGTNIFLF